MSLLSEINHQKTSNKNFNETMEKKSQEKTRFQPYVPSVEEKQKSIKESLI